MEARIAELIALAIVLGCIVEGASRGLALKVYSLVRYLLLLVLTMIITPLLLPVFSTNLPAREGFVFLIAMILSSVVLYAVAHLLKIIDHIPVIHTLNKLGGAVLGGIIGFLLVWTILFLVSVMQDLEYCRMISDYVRQSKILMQIQNMNPLTLIMVNFDFPIL